MRAPFIWTKPAYPILAKLDRLPVPLRGSLLSLRWRETDSNLRFPAAKETNPLREAVTGATKVRLQAVAYLPGTDGSNLVPSTGDSVANLTPWSRTIMLLTVKSAIAEDEQAVVACRDLAGPKPFRLLVPISPGCPEAASLCGQTRCWWIGRLMTAVCHLR